MTKATDQIRTLFDQLEGEAIKIGQELILAASTKTIAHGYYFRDAASTIMAKTQYRAYDSAGRLLCVGISEFDLGLTLIQNDGRLKQRAKSVEPALTTLYRDQHEILHQMISLIAEDLRVRSENAKADYVELHEDLTPA